jgi:hypothetical protein
MATEISDTPLKPRPPAKLPATAPPGAVLKELPTGPQIAAKRAAKATARLWYALTSRLREQVADGSGPPSTA